MDQKRLATDAKLELTQSLDLGHWQGTSGDCIDCVGFDEIFKSASSEGSWTTASTQEADGADRAETDLEGSTSLNIPLDAAQWNRSSVGSIKHAVGECRPCLFFFKAGGCKGGVKCNFCHLHYDSAYVRRKRLCNGKRRPSWWQIARLTALIRREPDCLSIGAIEMKSQPSLQAGGRAKGKLIPHVERRADHVPQASVPSRQTPLLESRADAASVNEAPVALVCIVSL